VRPKKREYISPAFTLSEYHTNHHELSSENYLANFACSFLSWASFFLAISFNSSELNTHKSQQLARSCE
jgi:hypothetical protein